ncbi:hypothetical protein [Hankyongella ginsenosidimutans]|uniref:hypothetical protein n=1 Tax=Hankyongella ginsenosidimutans TaxID=1763828 RepID=UPI001CA3180B|nr:hypothetical protein [Hankyongella ginsenosidimutans]
MRDQQVAERARYHDELADLERSRTAIEQLRQERERARRQVSLANAQTSQRLADLARETANLQDLLLKLETANVRSEHLASLPGHRFRPSDLGRRREQPAVQPDEAKRTGCRPWQSAAGRAEFFHAGCRPDRNRVRRAHGGRRDGARRHHRHAPRRAGDGGCVRPCAFAGEFRGYGLLLIVAHSSGYHSLLAGFARIDAAVGAQVRAGEPVG